METFVTDYTDIIILATAIITILDDVKLTFLQ